MTITRMTEVITVKQVSKSIKTKKILQDISFSVNQGDCLALIGPNGAGKTTLMSAILGDIKPSAGAIDILGKTSSDKALKSKVAVLFQENLVQKKMKVKELIDFQQAIYQEHLSSEEVHDLLGFSEQLFNSFASQLSGGQKRLLQFVLILIGLPEILILDEPTAGMDTTTRQYFWNLIEDLKAQGKTIVYTSHYIEEVEQTADRILVLHEGCLLRDTTPYALRKEEKAKVFTVPKDYQLALDKLDNISDIEVRSDNITFSTYQADRVFTVLRAAGCSIDDIEMTNRSLLDSIFL